MNVSPQSPLVSLLKAKHNDLTCVSFFRTSLKLTICYFQHTVGVTGQGHLLKTQDSYLDLGKGRWV